MQPFIHRTPEAACRNVCRREVVIQGHRWKICMPSIDDVLADPVTDAAFEQDEYLPYWADLWPSAEMLAGELISCFQPASLDGRRVLEIGCGLGLPGLAALALGAQVTFSDYDEAALQFAAENSCVNGFASFTTLALDWRHPPSGPKFDLLLAADVLYESRNVEPILRLAECVVKIDGEFLLVDPNRKHAGDFRNSLLQGSNFLVTTTPVHSLQSNGKIVNGTLYRLRRVAPTVKKVDLVPAVG